MWQSVVEAWLLNKLIRSPTFHKGVRWVHKRTWELKHGKAMEDMGGTKLDGPGESFTTHFVKELKQQLKGKSGR